MAKIAAERTLKSTSGSSKSQSVDTYSLHQDGGPKGTAGMARTAGRHPAVDERAAMKMDEYHWLATQLALMVSSHLMKSEQK